MKEQDNSPEKELNELEASYFSDIEFKIMIIRILGSMKKNRNHKKGLKKIRE